MGPFLVQIHNCEYINMHGFRELERTVQDRQCTYKRNIEAHSGNHCRGGKAKIMGPSCKFNFATIQLFSLLQTSRAYLLLSKKKKHSLESTFHIYLRLFARNRSHTLNTTYVATVYVFLKIFLRSKTSIWLNTRLFLPKKMHCLLKHKMLQFVLKVSLCMAPTCFGPSWTIIREHMMEPC